jgi:UDP-3-O-acyl-N-acetylglucosamine deacetylase
VTRRTIGRTVQLSGIGAWDFKTVRVMLSPAGPRTGIVFNRRIRATPASATVDSHSTCLGSGSARVRMVEHLLAACFGWGVTDLAVEVTGPDMPFVDGSSNAWVRLLDQAGFVDFDVPLVPLRLATTLTVEGPAGFIAVLPARGLRVNCLSDPPGAGRPQFVSIDAAATSFRRELAGARTFGPADGTPAVVQRRLGLGFKLARRNGIVYPARQRLPLEPCRHKILDMIGDLWLLGRPLEAELFAFRPGHTTNQALARAIAGRMEAH